MDPICILSRNPRRLKGHLCRIVALDMIERDEKIEANGCVGQAPEIQSMYSLGMPVSVLRTKMRQEFERHRYVNQLSVVDMLLFQSHAEYQVRGFSV